MRRLVCLFLITIMLCLCVGCANNQSRPYESKEYSEIVSSVKNDSSSAMSSQSQTAQQSSVVSSSASKFSATGSKSASNYSQPTPTVDVAEQYRQQLFQQAAEANLNQGASAAIEILRAGLSQLPNDVQLREKISYYEQLDNQPILLRSLKPFEDDGGGLAKIYESSWRTKDNLGNSYDPQKILYGNYGGGNEFWLLRSANTYYIEGKYSRITGIFYFTGIDSTTQTDTFTLSIYGDGALLYSSSTGEGIMPQSFDVDIANVEMLKVEMYTSSYAGLADCYLIK